MAAASDLPVGTAQPTGDALGLSQRLRGLGDQGADSSGSEAVQAVEMPDDDRRASDCSADKAASAMHSIDAVEWGSEPLDLGSAGGLSYS